MGLVAALMVFLFPLGMPILTLIGVVKVGSSSLPLPTRILRSFILAAVLMLALGPAIERNGAGSFALPWWLLLGGSANSYVWQYGLLVLAAAVSLSLLISGIRAARRRS